MKWKKDIGFDEQKVVHSLRVSNLLQKRFVMRFRTIEHHNALRSVSRVCSDLRNDWIGVDSEQFQLLCNRIGGFLLLPEENFHTAKLLVGDAEDSDTASLGQVHLYTTYMHIGIFAAGAVSYVYRELEHCEAIGNEFFAEIGIYLAFFLGFGRKVEEY